MCTVWSLRKYNDLKWKLENLNHGFLFNWLIFETQFLVFQIELFFLMESYFEYLTGKGIVI